MRRMKDAENNWEKWSEWKQENFINGTDVYDWPDKATRDDIQNIVFQNDFVLDDFYEL